MNAFKRLLVGAGIAATLIVPSYNATAWDGGGGPWLRGPGGPGPIGGPPGPMGGPPGPGPGPGRRHHGPGPGAAIAGLAVGAIVGSAIANAARGPAPAGRSCNSVMVDGRTYYNCGDSDYYGNGYNDGYRDDRYRYRYEDDPQWDGR